MSSVAWDSLYTPLIICVLCKIKWPQGKTTCIMYKWSFINAGLQRACSIVKPQVKASNVLLKFKQYAIYTNC